MRVKSVIIDGFKSYAHRQELSNLDHHFNAITGLNGSGKSNVFDAICFVMGLKNISKARVERQEELIFKNGKAGIVRAAVTIVFDNSDPNTAPKGHTEPEITITRQIDTGLRQRFFFNGRAKDQDSIRDFFKHASLNIDNPYFLVQQGQVHRLIGMKEKEVFGFIEEAAGTAMFDQSRKRAELQMRQKDKRLHEIDISIREEIDPMLRKIEEQEAENQKLQRVENDIGRLRNFKAAYDLWRAHRAAADAKAKLDTVNGRIAELGQEVAEVERSIRQKTALAEKLENDITEPQNDVEKYEAEVSALKSALTRFRSNLTQSQKQCAALEKEVQKNETEYLRAKEKYESFNSNNEGSIQHHEELRNQIKEKTEEITKLQQSIRLQKGGTAAGTGGQTLAEEKLSLEKSLTGLNGQAKRAQQSLDSLNQQLNQCLRDQQTLQQQQNQWEQQLERARRDLAMAEDAFRPHEGARKAAENLKGSSQQYYQRTQELWATLNRDYQMCAPLQYHRERVGREVSDEDICGRVAQLVDVNDETNSFALSVGAGLQSLLRVVVTSDRVAQALVERGQLSQRTSFMPLNTVQSVNQHQQQVLENKLAAARQLARDADDDRNGWAELAINLISFDPQYRPVMEKVFGNFLVCSSMRVARRVADDNSCKMKAVTIDGDVVEPSGLMHGGSRGNLQDILANFVRARPLLAAYHKSQQDSKQLQMEFQQFQQNSQKIQQLSDAVDRQRATVEQLEHQIQNSRFTAVENKIKQLTAEQQKVQEGLEKTIPAQIQGIKNRLDEIAKSETMDSTAILKDFERKLSDAQKKLKNLQLDLERGNERAEKEGEQKDLLQGKMDAIDGTLKEKKADLAQARAEEAKLVEEVQAHERNQQERVALLNAAKQKLESLKEEHQNVCKELENAREEKNELESFQSKSTTEQSEAERSYSTAAAALKKEESSQVIASFMTSAVRNSLGDPNGDYYFEDEQRTHQTLTDLAEGEQLIHALQKKVNQKQLATLEQRKAENRKLIEQRDALMEDKKKIIDSILQIEQDKWATLDEMVKKVSDQFGKLFNSCLNYATCRLEEKRDPDTKLLIGLEVKVSFNGKEKAGLTELSGGQRSLLAICLILAVLKMHKSPIYILDEVDAALDPSHTQKLGDMLKEKFSDAQFLLVSLKDGMFSSANVIYEVRNTQGFSEVTRKVNPQKSKAPENKK